MKHKKHLLLIMLFASSVFGSSLEDKNIDINELDPIDPITGLHKIKRIEIQPHTLTAEQNIAHAKYCKDNKLGIDVTDQGGVFISENTKDVIVCIKNTELN